MPFYGDPLRYFTFDRLTALGVKNAVFTRRGGVSPSPWEALNLGGTVGDEVDRIHENKRRAFETLGLKTETIYDVWQVHSSTVICTEHPRPTHEAPVKADAILTRSPGVTLFMRFADCTPIFLVDPVLRIAGIVHAGWVGTVNKIAADAVARMIDHYGSDPHNIHAAIGPSIGPDHYQVGEDVISQVKANFGEDWRTLLHQQEGKTYFDLWKANRTILAQAGVEEIESADLCTACHLEDWYSHRAEHGKTGRFGAVIAIEPEE